MDKGTPAIGRDGGDYSFAFDMETKHVSLAKESHRIQRLGIPSSRD
jgi:5-carboxymethyl-2-hydroxymuconic-semialdehyde dehydrogenase